MKSLIKIEVNEKQEQTVSGRELHAFLEVGTQYTKWFARMCDYGFEENQDFLVAVKNDYNPGGGKQEIIEHFMKIDMAKELCMLSRTEKGKIARQYFIQVEKDWNSPEKTMARALLMADRKIKELAQVNVVYEKQLEEQAPKVLFAKSVEASQTSCLVGELAKILKQNGVNIGQNRAFAWLRQNGYLIKSGENRNLPTQRSMDMKLMEIKKSTVSNPDGSVRVTRTTKVTGKGQIYFVNLFMTEHCLQVC